MRGGCPCRLQSFYAISHSHNQLGNHGLTMYTRGKVIRRYGYSALILNIPHIPTQKKRPIEIDRDFSNIHAEKISAFFAPPRKKKPVTWHDEYLWRQVVLVVLWSCHLSLFLSHHHLSFTSRMTRLNDHQWRTEGMYSNDTGHGLVGRARVVGGSPWSWWVGYCGRATCGSGGGVNGIHVTFFPFFAYTLQVPFLQRVVS